MRLNYMFDNMSTRTNLLIIQIPKKAMSSKLNNGAIGDMSHSTANATEH